MAVATALLLATAYGSAARSTTVSGGEGSNSLTPTSPTDDTPPPGQGLPYSVVSTPTPALPLGTFAATNLPDLTALLTKAAGRAPRCPGGTCFADAAPPPDSLLVLFSPSVPCQVPTGFTVALADTRLTINVETKNACEADGGGSRQVLDVLLAIPPDDLPKATMLTITSTGPMTPTASTTISIS